MNHIGISGRKHESEVIDSFNTKAFKLDTGCEIPVNLKYYESTLVKVNPA